MIEAGKRVVQSGIDLSVTLISGLGGKGKVERACNRVRKGDE